MNDLTAFITARLDEDEATAKEAVQETTGRWNVRETDWGGGPYVDDESGAMIMSARHPAAPQYMHIARHDPARVLREVEAKRAIVERCEQAIEDQGIYMEDGQEDVAVDVLHELATAWGDHPDYRPEWDD